MSENLYKVIKTDDFRNDLRAAASYYRQAESLKLALRFVDAVENVIGRLSNRPQDGAPLKGKPGFDDIDDFSFRRRPIRDDDGHFPYSIYYEVDEETVTLWALADQRALNRDIEHKASERWLADKGKDDKRRDKAD